MIQSYLTILMLAVSLGISGTPEPEAEPIHLRINQAGYIPGESKSCVVFSRAPVREKFRLVEAATGQSVLAMKAVPSKATGWGSFDYYYILDFSQVDTPGRYYLEGAKSGARSGNFTISRKAYDHYPEILLGFMRQQRCGYNPFLDKVCHQRDGRSFYGPMHDSTYVDVSGGWHDAGDQLKYLITGSYATGHMLLAYELYPDRFEDHCNAFGQPGSNGIPDVLDEARWGLDWICLLYTSPSPRDS